MSFDLSLCSRVPANEVTKPMLSGLLTVPCKLSEEQRAACLAFVYLVMKLSMAMLITSQNSSAPTFITASLTLHELANGNHVSPFGTHTPDQSLGEVFLTNDTCDPWKEGLVYCDSHDLDAWSFRNTMNLSVDSESRMASQVDVVTGSSTKRMLHESMPALTMDANRRGYVRPCKPNRAFAGRCRNGHEEGAGQGRCLVLARGPGVDFRIILSEMRKLKAEPETLVAKLTAQYIGDLHNVEPLEKHLIGKAVDADVVFRNVLELSVCGGAGVARAPSTLIRAANHSHCPIAELATVGTWAGKPFPGAAADVVAHIIDAFNSTAFMPGHLRSCVPILRNILAKHSLYKGRSSSELSPQAMG